jgi:4-amino-4-deoxychorismate mutase
MEPGITEATLAQYRSEIDNLDRRLMELMAARLELCLRIGRLKQALGLPMMQNGRIAEVLARVAERASRHRVSPEFAAAVWRMIIDEACRLERDDPHGRLS